ncbi:MAG TPA: glycerol-3-phosphate acyltransferase [Actinomycetota bacterium]|jgi:glycerol-3-phosphate acyltransferase PlsY
MTFGRALWVLGGYFVGTLPSVLIVARARRATALLSTARRDAGETDPHMIMWKQLGIVWTIVAATLDVVKGFVYLLIARHWGRQDTATLALIGAAVVLGHSFPFYARDMAGRGLAAASGVFLVLLPVEMAIAGIIIVIGGATRNTGLSSTIAMGSIPWVAAFQGQPRALVAMAAAIFALMMIRRVEGVGQVINSGVPASKAIWYRCVFDANAPAEARRDIHALPREHSAQ